MSAHDSGKPVLETMQRDLGEHFDHRGKLRVAMDAEILKDLRELMRMDRGSQQRMEDELLGPRKVSTEPAVNDILIDSPVRHEHNYPVSKGAGTWGTAVAILAASLGPSLLGLAMLFKGGSSPPAPATLSDSHHGIYFYDADGKPIKVKHIDEKPK